VRGVPEDPSRLARRLEVLGCDNHVLACAKPAGWPTVPDDSGAVSLLDVAREWVRERFEKPGRVFLGVVQRLDRPVSGVVVFARTSKAAARLTDSFREGRATKTYRAVMEGAPDAETGLLEIWLTKDPERNRSRIVAPESPGARRALTGWRVLRSGSATGEACGVEFTPRTGRSHQLRLTACALGHPLLGDVKYGAREPLRDRSIALHALSLRLPHPTRDEEVEFEVAVPSGRFWAPAR